MNSRLPGFHKLSAAARRALVAKETGIPVEELDAFDAPAPREMLAGFVENVIGAVELPLGVATNFQVNGRDVLVPMAVEESSVIAAASHGAKLARAHGGFTARADDPIMVGQVQLVDVPDMRLAQRNIWAISDEIAAIARDASGSLTSRGGGYRGLSMRTLDTVAGKYLVIHLRVDVRDAMGANAVNGVAEAVAPMLAEASGGRALLKILTNLADERLVHVTATFDKDELGGEAVVRDIIHAWAFADADPYRAATHNKGIMNGIDPVILATGNDWRAAEAGAHAYAARSGRYRSLTTYDITPEGHLRGRIELPLAVGIVGGVTRIHPTAKLSLRVLNVSTASELAQIAGAVGLAQNVAALRALAAEGIQHGHMRLHARNLALQAGVPADHAGDVVKKMLATGKAPTTRLAAEVWASLQSGT